MRIVLLCTDQSNQIALAHKIAREFELAGIVIEKIKRKKHSLKDVFFKILYKVLFYKIIQSWWNMLAYYSKHYAQWPVKNYIEVESINDDRVKEFIIASEADLVMVSGTSMIREKILSIPLTIGMINLHTGLSPYIKGSPNCTNWCISTNQFHLIGNSIMWIDKGIDSGDLLATAIVSFTGEENLDQIHIKVMEEAHSLYLKAVDAIVKRKSRRVKQDSIGNGVTFYNKDWNFTANFNLLKNLKHFKQVVTEKEYKLKVNATAVVNEEYH